MKAKTQSQAKTQTANEITNRLLLDIPKFYPDSIAWRNNTGGGVGWSTVKQVLALLRRGDVQAAIKILTTRLISWGLIGSSDIIMVVGPHGRFVGIEVKAEGDTQSPGQLAFQLRVEALGGAYIIVGSTEQGLLDLRAAVDRWGTGDSSGKGRE